MEEQVPALQLARIVDRFRGRKGFPTQNVLAVVDFDLIFMYVSAGWEGFAHDSTVLRHSLEHPNGLRVPEGWWPYIVAEILRPGAYRLKTIKGEGPRCFQWLMVFREIHHEECVKQINAKYHTNFTQWQVYHKYHKLKGQWKVILQAKNLSGANFDDVKKMILYDETEVVRMHNDKDPRAKFINVPIHCYNEMEFIFQDKHATGEFTVLQVPYDLPSTQDGDLIDDKNVNRAEDVDPGLQYDSDCLHEEEDGNNGESSSSKRPAASKPERVKRTKHDDSAISEVTHVLGDMFDTMCFTHVTHPNEELFKTIDAMKEYPLFVRLELQEYLVSCK
ncbi:uncharacterized protein [Miscanthus floridulus]|uniref:uncharacterized protein n=1 Tax=Miscanthus floridulus TaxID=154761 RepID=UPI0034587A4D